MIKTSSWRILRNALQNFQRNIWLSLATTIIMTLTLIMTSFLYFLNVLGSEVLNTIEEKVDLSATFKDDIAEDQISIIAEDIRSRADVQEARVVTSEQALEDFRARHADDPFIEESLRELEKNPLPSTLFIIAADPRQYQTIASELETERYEPFIESVNFENSRTVIERLIAVMSGVRNIGLVTTVVLASLVIMIMFNTIRLAIYSFREEIDIMRLVGASNWFIRGPFIIEAVMVALLSVIVSTFVLYPVLETINPEVQRFFFSGQAEPFSIYSYALSHWTTVIGLEALLAVGLAVFSSLVAIRRYLR
ncbi:MAG: ABC transporter permease [Candidatus Andersenbacteria bacterium]|nr:ABC transporter permease [Candidatus Andersenbacteria bacterium]